MSCTSPGSAKGAHGANTVTSLATTGNNSSATTSGGCAHQHQRQSTNLAGQDALPTINCVVSNLNLEEMPDMVRFAQAIGFHVSFLPVELLADPKDGVRNWEARFVRYRPEMSMAADDGAEEVGARIDAAYDAVINRSIPRRGL